MLNSNQQNHNNDSFHDDLIKSLTIVLIENINSQSNTNELVSKNHINFENNS